jgi:hypothetical protein
LATQESISALVALLGTLTAFPCTGVGVGVAVGVEVGVAVGVGSGVGDGVDVGVTVGVGSGDGVTVGEGLGIGLGIRRLKACLRWRGACLSEARCTGVAGSMSERSAIWSTALLST